MQRGKGTIDSDTGESWTKNTFFLRRLGSSPTCPTVEVHFSPSHSTPLEHLNACDSPTFPSFNLDGCYYTPAFILAIDQPKYVSNAGSYLSLHESKQEQLANQKTQLLVPKPSKVNSFCCICKLPFEDYLTHVNVPKHQELMRGSEFALSISDICSHFPGGHVEEQEESKKNKSKKKIRKAPKPKKVNQQAPIVVTPVKAYSMHLVVPLIGQQILV